MTEDEAIQILAHPRMGQPARDLALETLGLKAVDVRPEMSLLRWLTEGTALCALRYSKRLRR